MKKLFPLMVLAMMSVCLMLSSCDDEKTISVEQLPAPAKAFIEKNYPGTSIMFAQKETEWFVTEYKATLDNGLEVKFDSDGAPLDIDRD